MTATTMEMNLLDFGFEELNYAELETVDGGGLANAIAYTAGSVVVAVGGIVAVVGAIAINPVAVVAGFTIVGFGLNTMNNAYIAGR